MSQWSRRHFLTEVSAAGAALAAGRLAFAVETNKKRRIRSGTDLVTLGRSGLTTSVLGMGTGTNSGNQQRALGREGYTKLLRHGLDRGLRFIDTADSYRAHAFVRNALKGVPRERYFIQTKCSSHDANGAKGDIERFLTELDTDYIDSLLMHYMIKGSWPTDMRPVMDVFEDAKRKGRIRAYGISCHGWESLSASLATDWPDVQLARINPFGKMMDGKPEDVAAVLKQAHDKGRGVIGMKIFGETGLDNREQRLESLKYVLGRGCVDCFTIGFTRTSQIDETLELIEQALA